MPRVTRNISNPFGLSIKQQLVIKDIANRVKDGKPFDPVSSTERFYNVKNRKSAAVISSQNLNRLNFRKALSEALVVSDVLEKYMEVVTEGLYAYQIIGGVKLPDYLTRLKYIQELNKITGVYQS